MNRYIEQAFNNYEIKFEKNLGYGHIKGYEVNIYNNAMQNGPILFISTYLSHTNKNILITKIHSHGFKMVNAYPVDYGIAILIGVVTGKAFLKKAHDVIETVFKDVEEIGGLNAEYCPYSGEQLSQLNSKMITLPDTKCKIQLSLSSVEAINSSILNANKDFNESENNYLKGFFGVLIGAVVGVVLTNILSALGFISAISSVAAIAIGIALYKKFGGKPNGVMIIMSFLTTAVFILGFVYLAYSSLAASYVVEDNINLNGVSAFSYCMNNLSDFKQAFVSDILLNLLFIVIGEACMIGSIIKAIRRPKTI